MPNLLGTNSAQKKSMDMARQQQEQSQRRTLADLSRQQAEADQAAAGPTGRQSGGRMLTFLTGLSGDGLNKFGQA